MPLSALGPLPNTNPLLGPSIQQFIDLLTGAMTDQPVVFANTFTLSASSSGGVLTLGAAGLVGTVAPGSSGNVLTSSGGVWASVAAASGATNAPQLRFSCQQNGLATGTQYMGGIANATEAVAQLILGSSFSATSMSVYVNPAPGAGNTWTITARKNAVGSTTLTTTITGAATTATIAGSTVFAKSDLSALQWIGSSGVPVSTGSGALA